MAPVREVCVQFLILISLHFDPCFGSSGGCLFGFAISPFLAVEFSLVCERPPVGHHEAFKPAFFVPRLEPLVPCYINYYLCYCCCCCCHVSCWQSLVHPPASSPYALSFDGSAFCRLLLSRVCHPELSAHSCSITTSLFVDYSEVPFPSFSGGSGASAARFPFAAGSFSWWDWLRGNCFWWLVRKVRWLH